MGFNLAFKGLRSNTLEHDTGCLWLAGSWELADGSLGSKNTGHFFKQL